MSRWQRAIACVIAVIGSSVGTSAALAGWGHRLGHHHHHHFYGGGLGWGFPSYSYTSFYFSVPRVRLYYPSYHVGYYSYYAPSYSIALPSYYYAAPTVVLPSYYAPVVYPSYTNCCDPCSVSAITTPSSSTYSAPEYSIPEYSTGVGPQSQTSPQLASMAGGSFVDRMLGRSSTVSTKSATVPSYLDMANRTSSRSTDSRSPGAVRNVSTLKPVTSLPVPPSSNTSGIDQLSPIPPQLLQAADDIFAAGGYEQAASAYARLTVRYGNHSELAVRRFIALVALGDHTQASIVYELSLLNEQPLTIAALPDRGLAGLYGANAVNRQKHIDSLAGYALRSEGAAIPLAMVGTWLELDGQAERAATFLKRAEMLLRSQQSDSSPTLAIRLADSPMAR